MATLRVPGATLRYAVRGTGPVLLLIPGGPEDMSGFAELGDALADRFRVVTYDPRGISGSPLDGEPVDVPVATFADDAHRLLGAVGAGPADVVGESGGAVVGLDLVTRYPDSVRHLVAHEPPCLRVLSDPAPFVAAARAVVGTLHREGVGAAMGEFLALAGFDPDAPAPEPRPSVLGNLEFFLDHLLLETIDRYTPDVERLRSRPVTVTVGADSVGQLPYRTATALAERLDRDTAVMPGDHFGISRYPAEFAARLRELLG